MKGCMRVQGHSSHDLLYMNGSARWHDMHCLDDGCHEVVVVMHTWSREPRMRPSRMRDTSSCSTSASGTFSCLDT